jgi:hypothetical protein
MMSYCHYLPKEVKDDFNETVDRISNKVKVIKFNKN